MYRKSYTMYGRIATFIFLTLLPISTSISNTGNVLIISDEEHTEIGGKTALKLASSGFRVILTKCYETNNANYIDAMHHLRSIARDMLGHVNTTAFMSDHKYFKYSMECILPYLSPGIYNPDSMVMKRFSYYISLDYRCDPELLIV